MIGQNKIKKWCEKFKEEDSFPRCILLVGEKGLGKRTCAKYIAQESGKQFVLCGSTVDEVREVIRTSNKCTIPTYFCFPNCEDYSPSAINALLKVIEEPPRNASFILTCTLKFQKETISSRCVRLFLEQYSEDELLSFTSNANNLYYTSNPEKLLRLEKYGKGYSDKLIAFCDNVVDNIRSVTLTNSMKIVDYLNLKENDTGFDVDLFFEFMYETLYRRLYSNYQGLSDSMGVYEAMISKTAKAMGKVGIIGLKKDSILYEWILDMRS